MEHINPQLLRHWSYKIKYDQLYWKYIVNIRHTNYHWQICVKFENLIFSNYLLVLIKLFSNIRKISLLPLNIWIIVIRTRVKSSQKFYFLWTNITDKIKYIVFPLSKNMDNSCAWFRIAAVVLDLDPILVPLLPHNEMIHYPKSIHFHE